jgi:hypothetical protein
MLLEKRNKDLTNLHKAADYLSRSLRENLQIFSVDSSDKKVHFLSERNSMISCNYEVRDSKLALKNFGIESVDDFISTSKVDDHIKESIDSFIGSLQEDRFDKADTSFEDIIGLFEQRNGAKGLQVKVEKCLDPIAGKTEILDSREFKKLEEVKPLVVNFLRDNQDKIIENSDMLNSVKVSNAIDKAFSVDRTNYDSLKEVDMFVVDLCDGQSLYEMICHQELISQELLDAKKSFSTVWISNDKIQNLASMIYAKSDAVKEALSETIQEVPYFAFAPKSEIQEMLTSIYEVNSNDLISKKDIKGFTKTLFEAKKPAKEQITQALNENYGINVTNLKFVPTFSNLAKTQSVFFEVLSLLSKDEGVVHDVSRDFAKFVSKKGGVETLDVNDYVNSCLSEAGLDLIDESLLANYINVPKLTKDLAALKTLLGVDGGEGVGVGAEGPPSPLEVEGEEDIEEEGEGIDGPDEEFPVTDQDAQAGPGEESEVAVDDEEPFEGENGEAQPEEKFGNGEAQPEEKFGNGGDEAPVGDDSVESGGTGSEERHADASKLVADLEALVKGMGVNSEEDVEDEEQYGA